MTSCHVRRKRIMSIVAWHIQVGFEGLFDIKGAKNDQLISKCGGDSKHLDA